jgi:hypothetical protein
MKWIRIASLVILPLGMAAIFGLETWHDTVRRAAGQTFEFIPVIVFTSVLDIIYATVLLAMFWLTQKGNDWRVGIVYLLIGLLTFLTPILYWRGVPISRYLPLDSVALNFDRGFWLLGAFITVIGAWAILSSRATLAVIDE